MSTVLESLVSTKRVETRDRGEAVQGKQNDDFFALYPTVYALLRDRQIGSVKRDLSKVSISLKPEGWITTLTEPASGQVIFSQSDTLLKCFEALEGRVSKAGADWREDKYAKHRKPKK